MSWWWRARGLHHQEFLICQKWLPFWLGSWPVSGRLSIWGRTAQQVCPWVSCLGEEKVIPSLNGHPGSKELSLDPSPTTQLHCLSSSASPPSYTTHGPQNSVSWTSTAQTIWREPPGVSFFNFQSASDQNFCKFLFVRFCIFVKYNNNELSKNKIKKTHKIQVEILFLD